jgi:hypothetical protein
MATTWTASVGAAVTFSAVWGAAAYQLSDRVALVGVDGGEGAWIVPRFALLAVFAVWGVLSLGLAEVAAQRRRRGFPRAEAKVPHPEWWLAPDRLAQTRQVLADQERLDGAFMAGIGTVVLLLVVLGESTGGYPFWGTALVLITTTTGRWLLNRRLRRTFAFP